MIFVITGAPGSGKTTYVKERMKDDDIVFDYDYLVKAITLSEKDRHFGFIPFVMELRSSIIDLYRKGQLSQDLWIIATEFTSDLKEQLRSLPVKHIELRTSILEIKRRLKEDPIRSQDLEREFREVDKYFIKQNAESKFYKQSRWRDARNSTLVRDDYECRICKRYGTTTEAKEVHHINLLNLRPDLKADTRNLISVCSDCHKRLHDHINHDLSTLGQEILKEFETQYPELVI